MADLSPIVSGVSSVAQWFWSIFSDFFGIITGNAAILWPVLFALVAGSVAFLLRFLGKIGLRGRR